MKVLVVFFSRTGTTSQVALAMADWLRTRASVTIEKICPIRSRSYLEWLILSAIPTSRVKIRPTDSDFSQYDLVLLGFPKWTLSCPPVNEYLNSVSNFEGKRCVLFMTYGGFDQWRYMKTMASVLQRKKMRVEVTIGVSRASVRSGAHVRIVSDFLKRLPDLSPLKRTLQSS